MLLKVRQMLNSNDNKVVWPLDVRQRAMAVCELVWPGMTMQMNVPTSPKGVRVGLRVTYRFEEDDGSLNWYSGTISARNAASGKDMFDVTFEDADEQTLEFNKEDLGQVWKYANEEEKLAEELAAEGFTPEELPEHDSPRGRRTTQQKRDREAALAGFRDSKKSKPDNGQDEGDANAEFDQENSDDAGDTTQAPKDPFKINTDFDKSSMHKMTAKILLEEQHALSQNTNELHMTALKAVEDEDKKKEQTSMLRVGLLQNLKSRAMKTRTKEVVMPSPRGTIMAVQPSVAPLDPKLEPQVEPKEEEPQEEPTENVDESVPGGDVQPTESIPTGTSSSNDDQLDISMAVSSPGKDVEKQLGSPKDGRSPEPTATMKPSLSSACGDEDDGFSFVDLDDEASSSHSVSRPAAQAQVQAPMAVGSRGGSSGMAASSNPSSRKRFLKQLRSSALVNASEESAKRLGYENRQQQLKAQSTLQAEKIAKENQLKAAVETAAEEAAADAEMRQQELEHVRATAGDGEMEFDADDEDDADDEADAVDADKLQEDADVEIEPTAGNPSEDPSEDADEDSMQTTEDGGDQSAGAPDVVASGNLEEGGADESKPAQVSESPVEQLLLKETAAGDEVSKVNETPVQVNTGVATAESKCSDSTAEQPAEPVIASEALGNATTSTAAKASDSAKVSAMMAFFKPKPVQAENEDENGDEGHESDGEPKDRAAAYRAMLEEEEKRRSNKDSNKFMADQAEESEEETEQQAGVGDYGFGAPKAKSKEQLEEEEEDRIGQVREDDLDGIVDDLSGDEDLNEDDMDNKALEDREKEDKHELAEVMRNVREGFGRRSNFLSNGANARGQFSLNQLVSSNDKDEAKRLGLLTQAEIDEDDQGEQGGGGDDLENEEQKMLRMLNERVMLKGGMNELSSDEEEEEEEEEAEVDADGNAVEVDSEEEEEKATMAHHAKLARMQRVLKVSCNTPLFARTNVWCSEIGTVLILGI
jgi:hypothetical protein